METRGDLSGDMDALTRATAAAIRKAPVGIRELARAAGLSHTLLSYVVADARRATPAVARAIAGALEALGQEATAAGKALRRAIRIGGER
jgi:hypothetical protein